MAESPILTNLRSFAPSFLGQGGRSEFESSFESERDQRRKAGAVQAERWRREQQDGGLSRGSAEFINPSGKKELPPPVAAIGPPPLPPPLGHPPTDSLLGTPADRFQWHPDAMKASGMQIRSALPQGGGESILLSGPRFYETGLPPAMKAPGVQMRSGLPQAGGPPLPNISMAPSSQLTGPLFTTPNPKSFSNLAPQAVSASTVGQPLSSMGIAPPSQFAGTPGLVAYPQSFPNFSASRPAAVASPTSFSSLSPPPWAAVQQQPTMQGLQFTPSPFCQQAMAQTQQSMQKQISDMNLGQPSSALRDHSSTPPTPPDRLWRPLLNASSQSPASRRAPYANLELSISAAIHPHDPMSVSGVLSSHGSASHVSDCGPKGFVGLSDRCLERLAANQGALAQSAFDLASRASHGNVQQGLTQGHGGPNDAAGLDGQHQGTGQSIGAEQVTSPERARRAKAVSDAQAQLWAMKAKGKNDKAARKAADQALERAEDDLEALPGLDPTSGEMREDLKYAGKKVAVVAMDTLNEMKLEDWLAWTVEKGKVVSSEAASYVPFLIPGDPGDPEDRKQPVYKQLNPFGDAVDYVGVMRLVQALAVERPDSSVTRTSSTNRYLDQLILGDKQIDMSSPLVASCNQMVTEEWNDYVVCDFWTQHSELSNGADKMLLRSLVYDACMGHQLAPKEQRNLVYKTIAAEKQAGAKQAQVDRYRS